MILIDLLFFAAPNHFFGMSQCFRISHIVYRSCGKVIFSQASVSHSVHRGLCIPACTGADTPTLPLDRHSPTLPLADIPLWAGTPSGRQPLPRQTPPFPRADTPSPGQTSPWADTPQANTPAATAAYGTHPTGMLSCLKYFHNLKNIFLQSL